MQIEVIMPKMGESIQEGTILRWCKNKGESVEKDETILEISTDKVDSEIPSPASGILANILVSEQQTVSVGTVIAYIETDKSAEKVINEDNAHIPNPLKQNSGSEKIQERSSTFIKKSYERTNRFYSPLVKNIAKKEGIDKVDLEAIIGSGSGGRVTKYDILNYIKQISNKSGLSKIHKQNVNTRSIDISELEKKYPSPEYRIVRISNVQKKMAEHMVSSAATSPQVTIVDEVDVTSIVKHRFRILEELEKSKGFKLTYTHYFAYTVIETLKEFPIINSSIEGDAIIYKNFINLGIAVATSNGLMVPVVHRAQNMNFQDLARALNDLADRARSKKLVPEDTLDGTFSITNYGVFGSLIGTPIINQPQVAILGVGAIQKRPIVIDDSDDNPSIAVRSMVYLTLTFDHRIIDGAIGGEFLARVKWHLENFNFQGVDSDFSN